MTGYHDDIGAFHEPIYIEFRDMDCDQHVRLSTWLAWLAGLAGDDYECRGLGRDELIRRGQVFLVNRFSLKVHRSPRTYETLQASTWEHGTELIYFNRHYHFETGEGEPVADARSTWLLCDPASHRILRPRVMAGTVRDIQRDAACPPVAEIDVPEEMAVLGERRIVYTDLDANRHVFCANYGNIIADFLPEHIVSKPVSTLEITYAKEALLGETLTIAGQETEDGYVMVGRHPDGNNSFISRITV